MQFLSVCVTGHLNTPQERLKPDGSDVKPARKDVRRQHIAAVSRVIVGRAVVLIRQNGKLTLLNWKMFASA